MLSRVIRNEYLQGIGVLSAICLFFLSWPILNYPDHVLSPVGLLQSNTLTRLTENPPWVNPYLGDVVYVIQPWLLYNRDSLQAGQLPLWNPYNGNGAPHLANFQSAIFSVFTLPFYVLDFKAAVLVASFLALLGHGFFAFAFLKQLRLHQAAALAGAVSYLFGGYHVIWLGWLPLVGSGVALPAALFFSQAIFNRLEAAEEKEKKGLFWLLAGFSGSLLVGLLAGHPETFYAALVLTAAYVAFGLIRRLRHLGWSRQAVVKTLVTGGQFTAAALIVPLIAGAQLLPFLEYLSHSMGNPTGKSQVALPLSILPLLVFPNLLGNPSGPYHPILQTQDALWNFPESNSLYLGAITLLLAIASLPLARRSWPARFFGLAALLWLVYVFDLFSTRAWFKLIPGASIVLPIRTYDIWLFSASCSAALFLDHALHSRAASPKWAMAVMGAGTALLASAWLGAVTLLRQFANTALQNETAFVEHSLTHLTTVSVSFVLGMTLTAALFLISSRRWKGVVASALIALVFYQGGYVFKPYNPIAREELFYPRPAALQRLQRDVGDATLVIVGQDTIPPNVNLVYRLRMLTNYDGFWGRAQRRLYRVLFDAPPSALIPSGRADPRALQMFGVEFVATIGAENSEIANSPYFELLWQEGQVRLYRFTKSLTRYFTVDDFVPAADQAQAWQIARSADFDPARFVLLMADEAPALSGGAGQAGPARPAQVIVDRGDYVQLRATRDRPGYLVLAMTHYPGWKAKVNGEMQPVLRANYTFSAIPLPAGESVIEFYYDPDSFKTGVALSVLGLGLAGALVVSQGLRRPTSRPS
jgi:hypothetical protein